ncbi:response regulator, partial [candidate division TA06 bacterium]|nr:response regulator [candidate division TA06 bacterium]
MKNQEKILICDGDDLRARSLALAFSESSPDWTIGVVQRGQDGLNMLRENPQDCILLQETGIPDKEGLSLLKEIRELDGEVPIILLSKKPILNKVLEAIHLGIFDYLKEPYTITEVLNVVRLAIEKNKLQMEKERLLQELQDDKEKLVKKEDKKKGKEEKRGGSPMEPPLKSEQLLSKCLTLSMDLLQANKGVAFLVDKKSNRLIVKETIGFDDYFLKDSSFDLKDKKDLGKVVSQGKPCIISRDNVRLACAPLGNPPLVFGVIGLSRPWSFTDSDLKILSVFTPLAPYSLEGARVHT